MQVQPSFGSTYPADVSAVKKLAAPGFSGQLPEADRFESNLAVEKQPGLLKRLGGFLTSLPRRIWNILTGWLPGKKNEATRPPEQTAASAETTMTPEALKAQLTERMNAEQGRFNEAPGIYIETSTYRDRYHARHLAPTGAFTPGRSEPPLFQWYLASPLFSRINPLYGDPTLSVGLDPKGRACCQLKTTAPTRLVEDDPDNRPRYFTLTIVSEDATLSELQQNLIRAFTRTPVDPTSTHRLDKKCQAPLFETISGYQLPDDEIGGGAEWLEDAINTRYEQNKTYVQNSQLGEWATLEETARDVRRDCGQSFQFSQADIESAIRTWADSVNQMDAPEEFATIEQALLKQPRLSGEPGQIRAILSRTWVELPEQAKPFVDQLAMITPRYE